MDSLNIEQGTKEVSIFNELDESDGKKDGYLTETQYFSYQKEVTLAKLKEQELELLDKVENEIQNEKELSKAKLDIKSRFKDAKFNDKDETVTIESLSIYKFDVSTIEKFRELNDLILQKISFFNDTL